jgi:hypothetical protein
MQLSGAQKLFDHPVLSLKLSEIAQNVLAMKGVAYSLRFLA